MSNPYGAPGAPQRKSRSPLYIALACGCAAIVVLVLAAGGVGVFLLTREPAEEPTQDPSISETATEDPTDEPTEEPSEDPTDEPPGPTLDPPSEGTLTISTEPLEEGTTLDTEDEQLTTENGKFVRITLTIENLGTETYGLAGDNFVVYGSDGTTYALRYASFSTSGPQLEPGEKATAALYVDVAEDVVIESVSYTDPVGTGGEEVGLPVN
ncbi:DUF4352 domain-containing protein [Brachybacterium sp. FME24]|uniref:DUF4352 domain-containing protein n=1 Tax=Brachybacterium sp. FME24 TaxID=2742605 RepID=UPI0018692A82|nr:DUF4352 domain-containing protein [Brachybacterium sp. FME24]